MKLYRFSIALFVVALITGFTLNSVPNMLSKYYVDKAVNSITANKKMESYLHLYDYAAPGYTGIYASHHNAQVCFDAIKYVPNNIEATKRMIQKYKRHFWYQLREKYTEKHPNENYEIFEQSLIAVMNDASQVLGSIAALNADKQDLISESCTYIAEASANSDWEAMNQATEKLNTQIKDFLNVTDNNAIGKYVFFLKMVNRNRANKTLKEQAANFKSMIEMAR